MMKPRVFLIAVALSAGMACNRAQTDRDAERAAEQVKGAAAQAGDKLADSWLTTKIQAQFFADDDIKARYINVSTHDGMVKLKGFVENEDVRRQVLDIARNTDGVKQVDDRDLRIGPPPAQGFETASAPTAPTPVPTTGVTATPATGTALDDATVTSLVQAKYFLDPTIKARHIDVQTAHGVVTLRGQVASDTERTQALSLARATQGVQRVEDSLTVDASLDQAASSLSSTPGPGASGTPTSPGASVDNAGPAHANTPIEKELESRLAADTAVKTANIDVIAQGPVVTLQGTAPTQAAKARALTIASEMNGVTQVIDRISVAAR